MASDRLNTLIKEYDAHFSGISERAAPTYGQVWP